MRQTMYFQHIIPWWNNVGACGAVVIDPDVNAL